MAHLTTVHAFQKGYDILQERMIIDSIHYLIVIVLIKIIQLHGGLLLELLPVSGSLAPASGK